jgi:hypothetical protein
MSLMYRLAAVNISRITETSGSTRATLSRGKPDGRCDTY